MKKILVPVMFFMGLIVTAQEIKYGIKTGLDIANFIDETKKSSIKTFYHAGVLSEIKLSDKFAIQPEILFSFGADQPSYLLIPITVKYFVDSNLALEIGPQVGFSVPDSDSDSTGKLHIIDSTGKLHILNSSTPNLETKNSSYTMKSVDFGLNFGASYTFNFNLSIGARYNLGLTDLTKKRISGGTVKNGVFQVSIGYFFY